MKKIHIYFILIGVMLAWGFNVPTLKLLVEHFSPITMSSLRILTAGIFVFIILAFMRLIRRPTRKEATYIVFGGLLNVVCHHFFLSIGLTATTATNGGLILGMGPLLTTFMAMLFLRQRPTIIRFSGFILGCVGVSLIVLAGSGEVAGITIGDLSVFLSIFTQALSFILISRAAKTLDPRLLTGYMMIFGAVVLFIISLWMEPHALKDFVDAPWQLWIAFFASAILATAIGHMIYNYAIGKTGPAEASIFINLSTFFSLIGSAIILNEKITSFHLVGLVFIITGVILGSGALEELILKRSVVKTCESVKKPNS